MLQFDPNGYLTPPEIQPTTLPEFERTFATNHARTVLYQQYLDFIVELKNWSVGHFRQWVDGSFTTQNPSPNDIDIVTFLPFDHKLMKDGFYAGLKKNFRRKGLDCYFVDVFPREHPNFPRFEDRRNLWFELFRSDRENTPKGFIQIDF